MEAQAPQNYSDITVRKKKRNYWDEGWKNPEISTCLSTTQEKTRGRPRNRAWLFGSSKYMEDRMAAK